MVEFALQRELPTRPDPGYVGRIPVRNLWLLMLYASDLFRARGVDKVGQESLPDALPDLVAEILAHAVESRQRRQLSLGYQAREAVLSRVRGRIDFITTERRHLLARGRVACRYAELTIDTPRNRFVRAALETVSRIVRAGDISHRCRSLARAMKAMGVSGNAPPSAELSTERYGRRDAHDRHMVAAAKLAFDLAMPNEEVGANVLSLPDREERWVRHLFERAVGGFYDVVLSPYGWRVQRGKMLDWSIEEKTAGIDAILPAMRTDVVLDHVASGQRIVIDTKFTSIVTGGWYREHTLRSGYLYQVYAYLRSQVGRHDPLADQASGLLLHPSLGVTIDETVTIQGHRIRFATIDLTESAAAIRSQLMQLCKPTIT